MTLGRDPDPDAATRRQRAMRFGEHARQRNRTVAKRARHTVLQTLERREAARERAQREAAARMVQAAWRRQKVRLGSWEAPLRELWIVGNSRDNGWECHPLLPRRSAAMYLQLYWSALRCGRGRRRRSGARRRGRRRRRWRERVRLLPRAFVVSWRARTFENARVSGRPPRASKPPTDGECGGLARHKPHAHTHTPLPAHYSIRGP